MLTVEEEDKEEEVEEEDEKDLTASFFVEPEEKWSGSGTISLSFIDDGTLEPIPHLGFVVYSERPREHALGRGRSDEKGQVQVTSLPEDTILIQTERTPPFCSTVAAVWLSERQSRNLVVRVRRGGIVAGRIVDDLGDPVPGAEVLLVNTLRFPLVRTKKRFYRTKDLVGHSKDDGSFLINHVRSRPRNVWIINGEERPESWQSVNLRIQAHGMSEEQYVAVDDGELIEVGDLVLRRAMTISGQVVDEAGSPIPGALVTTIRRRATWLWVTYKNSDVVTDEDGRFALHASPGTQDVFAMTSDGNEASTPLPKWKAGERVDDIVIELKRHVILHAELFENGRRVTQQELDEKRKALRDSGQSLFQNQSDWMKLKVERRDGSTFEVPLLDDGVESWFSRFSPEEAPSLRSLQVKIAGYECKKVFLEETPVSENRFRFEIEEERSYPLRLSLIPSGEPSASYHRVHACLGRPHMEIGEELACCGLGAMKGLFLESSKPTSCELMVSTEGPYYVAVHRNKGRFEWKGPYPVGQQVHEITVPTEDAKPEEAVAAEPTAPEPRTPHNLPPSKRPEGTLQVRAVNSKTQETISERISLEANGTKIVWFQRKDELDSVYYSATVPVGEGAGTLTAWGFEPSDEIVFEVLLGEVTDLGTVSLEPSPLLSLQILEPSGEPRTGRDIYRRIAYVQLASKPTQRTGRSTNDRGVLTIPGPEEGAVLTIYGKGGNGAQRLQISGWKDAEDRTLTIAPWIEMKLIVRGLAPEHALTSIRFEVVSLASGEEHQFMRREFPPFAGEEGRTTSVFLAEGEHLFRASSVLHTFEPVKLVISDRSNLEVIFLAR